MGYGHKQQQVTTAKTRIAKTVLLLLPVIENLDQENLISRSPWKGKSVKIQLTQRTHIHFYCHECRTKNDTSK